MDVDDLLAAPPKGFTAARNALAAQLRRAGKSTEAAAVARLRKPTLPVWVVNQLARRYAADVEGLVSAADDLRRASVGRGGDPQAATTKHRASLRALLRRAETILDQAGYRPSADVLLRVSNTLLGATTDRAARKDLAHGRLQRELPPPGLEILLDAPAAGPGTVVDLDRARDRRRATGEAQARRAAPAAAANRNAVRAAREAAQARKRAEAQARALLRRTEQAEAALRRRAERLERTAAMLRGRLETAERRAEEARAALRRAADELGRARGPTGRDDDT